MTKKINAIDTINKIVENKQYKEIHGVIVDLFTASAIKAVYAALGGRNKKRMNDTMTKNKKGLLFIADFSVKQINKNKVG